MLIEIFLDSSEDYLRVPESWMNMVVVGASEDVEFVSCKDSGLVGREVGDWVVMVRSE